MPKIINVIQNVFPKNGIITLDNGLYKLWFARNFLSTNPDSLLLDNALATMGAGLPSAMAAKLLYPERKIMAICGDGGFMMNSHELEPAVRLKLDFTIIILTDNAYGMVEWKQKKMGLKKYGLKFNNPDFIKYAEAYGANGYKIQNPEDLIPIIKKCIKSNGIKIIEVPIDYSKSMI